MIDNCPEFFSDRTVTARKLHRCHETGRVILPGDQAVIVTGKWDGRVRSFYYVPEVYELWKRVNQMSFKSYGEGIYFGELGEHFSCGEPTDSELHAEWERVKRR